MRESAGVHNLKCATLPQVAPLPKATLHHHSTWWTHHPRWTHLQADSLLQAGVLRLAARMSHFLPCSWAGDTLLGRSSSNSDCGRRSKTVGRWKMPGAIKFAWLLAPRLTAATDGRSLI